VQFILFGFSGYDLSMRPEVLLFFLVLKVPILKLLRSFSGASLELRSLVLLCSYGALQSSRAPKLQKLAPEKLRRALTPESFSGKLRRTLTPELFGARSREARSSCCIMQRRQLIGHCEAVSICKVCPAYLSVGATLKPCLLMATMMGKHCLLMPFGSHGWISV
jgi:hypothetical protein